jgi:hypothetical protein
MTLNIFFCEKIKKGCEKFFKKLPKKVISKASITNMSKIGKVHIFVTILLITFFGTFFKTFSTDLKSA